MPCVVDQAHQQPAVIIAGVVVELALRGLQIGVKDALGALRQFRCHLVLGAAQDERVNQAAQQLHRFLAGAAFDGRAKLAPEVIQAAQQTRVEEGELRPQLEGVVLHRRAGHHQAVPRVEQARRLGALRQRIFDRLRLIQDGIFEAYSAQEFNVAQHGAVGGQNDVTFLERRRVLLAEIAHEFQDAQPGGEAFRLALPVGDQGFRHHQQHR